MSDSGILLSFGFEGTVAQAIQGKYAPIFQEEEFNDTVLKLHVGNYDRTGELHTASQLIHLGVIATHSSSEAKDFLRHTRVYDCFKDPRQGMELIVGPNDNVPYVSHKVYAPPRRTFGQLLRKEPALPVPAQRTVTRRLIDKADCLEYMMNVCSVIPKRTVHIGSSAEDEIQAKKVGAHFIASTVSAKGIRQLRPPTFTSYVELALDIIENS